MRTAVKLSAYGLSLAIVFGGAWALGSAIGPRGEDTRRDGPPHHVTTTWPTPTASGAPDPAPGHHG